MKTEIIESKFDDGIYIKYYLNIQPIFLFLVKKNFKL